MVEGERFAGAFFAGDLFPVTGGDSGGERCAITDAPSSRVSSVVSILGDFTALAASFLSLGDVSSAGALGIVRYYDHSEAAQQHTPELGQLTASAFMRSIL